MKDIEILFDYLRDGSSVPPEEELVNNAIKEYNELQRKDFWSKWVYPEGASPEDIQKELLDYRDFMVEASKVYMYFTNNNISKVNTKAESVIGEIERFWKMRENENNN